MEPTDRRKTILRKGEGQPRRQLAFYNWSGFFGTENRPDRALFKDHVGHQCGRYQLNANELDGFGRTNGGGGLVATFDNLEAARNLAHLMLADHENYQPSVWIDPEDRFRNNAVQEDGAERDKRHDAHYAGIQALPASTDIMKFSWPGLDPIGKYTVVIWRDKVKNELRFDTEESALACFDRIVMTNPNLYPPGVKIDL